MLRGVRVLWIWLLVLALPAQAVMAATMRHCSPNHRPGHADAASPHGQAGDEPAGPEHAGHGADHAAEHAAKHASGHGAGPGHHHGDAAGVTSPATDTASTAHTKFIHADEHGCSACASCCSAAAVPSIGLRVPVPEQAPAVFVAVVPAIEKFAADGPDRPPRVLRA